MAMRTLITILTIGILAVITMRAADPALQSFQARSTGKAVSVEWRSGTEGGVVRYAKGSNHTYQFTDDEAFAKRDDASVAQGNLSYRLRIVRDDQSAGYSNTVTVTHSVSGIKRTWGMIKEMFR
jgi:hypothetical protein